MVSLFNLVSYFISVHKYNVLGGYIRTFGPREQSAILFLSAKGGGGKYRDHILSGSVLSSADAQ